MKTIYYLALEHHTLTGNHFMQFNNKQSRLSYLSSRVRFSGQQSFQEHAFIDELIVPFAIEQIRLVNYLYFFIGESSSDMYCYHILKSEYKSQNTSKLTLKLDVFTTYQFELTFKPSYIERCHVNRWQSLGIPSKELTGEPFSEYDKTIVHQDSAPITDGCYIYTSVNPLGKLTYRPTTGTGGNTPPSVGGGCGDYNLGIPSKNGFLFVKGFEGLAQYAHNIGDGVLTIGYGCTDRYDGENYQQLKANEPVSDELASEVFASSIVENYGIPLINQLESDGIVVVQHEFDALLSFVYNAGLGSLTASAIYSNLKAGNKQAAAQAWLTTNILAGSQFEAGLRERRQAESNIFLSGQYEIRNTLIYGQGGTVAGTLYTSTSSVPPLIENTCQGGAGETVNEMTEDDMGNIWQFPVKGIISATFPTYPDGTTHSGIDIAGNDGLKIRSSGVGTVIYVVTDTSTGYGNHVVVQMENGTQHWFGHMKTTPYVNVGDSVNHQTILGIVGSTGNSSGPHVHWEIRTSPYAYDFTCWVNPSPRSKVGDIIVGVGD